MRVLLVTEASSAGVGRHLGDLAGGLVDHGCRVDVAYSPRRQDAAFVDQVVANPRVRSHALPMRRGPHLSDLRALRRLRALLRQHGPFDIVHAHSSKAGAIVRLLGGRGARVVYTPHCLFTLNPGIGRAAGVAVAAVERYLTRRCDAVVAVSPDERDHMLGLGFDPSRVHCIVNGVGAMEFATVAAARDELGLPPGTPVIGFLGRMTAQKNPELLLRAFAAIAPRTRAVLAMVGDGALRPELQRLAAELGIAGRVLWPGHRRCAAAMPAFDVLVLPSRYEGLPYVLLEALAAGVPVVATDVGGVRHVLDGHGCGRVVPVDDPPRLAAALLEVLGGGAELAAAARLRARAFTAAGMVAATLGLYRRLLDRAAAPLPVDHQPAASP